MTASEATWEWSNEAAAAPHGVAEQRQTVSSDSGDSTRGDAEVWGGSPVAAQGQTFEAAWKCAGEHAVVMRSWSQATRRPTVTRSDEGEAMAAGTARGRLLSGDSAAWRFGHRGRKGEARPAEEAAEVQRSNYCCRPTVVEQ